MEGGAFHEAFGPDDSWRILDLGLLEVTTSDRRRTYSTGVTFGGRRRTYSPAAWYYVEERTAKADQ